MTSDKWDQNSTNQMSQMGNGCQTVRTAILKNMCLFLENFSKRLKITGCSVPRCRHSLDPPGTDPPAAAQPSPHPVEERTGELGEVGQTVNAEPEIKKAKGDVSYEL